TQLIDGGVVSATVTVWLQVFVLLQASIAAQVRVAEKVVPQRLLVTVVRITSRLVPHPSFGWLGGSKLQALPHSTVLSPTQLIDGGVVSATVTVWLQVLVLLQASIAAHVRVAEKVVPQRSLVTVFRITSRLVPHPSFGWLGGSKLQALPHSTVLSATQLIEGGVVSATVTVWLQVLVLLQASIAAQVRVAEKVVPQRLLVTVVRITNRLVPHPSFGWLGGSKLHALPHSAVLSATQLIDGGVVSATVTVWLQVLVLLQASIAAQVRVAEKVVPQRLLVTVVRITSRLVPHPSFGWVGASKLQVLPHSTVLSATQLIDGGVVSATVTV